MSLLKKYMVFSLGSERYAVALASVKEVTGLGRVTPLPGMPSHFLGLSNLRGTVISIIDLAQKLGIQTPKVPQNAVQFQRSCVIIVEIENRLVGLRVTDIVEVVTLADERIDRQVEGLAGTSKKGIWGTAKGTDSDLTHMIDLAKTVEGLELPKGDGSYNFVIERKVS